jgi:hypothetical protein
MARAAAAAARRSEREAKEAAEKAARALRWAEFKGKQKGDAVVGSAAVAVIDEEATTDREVGEAAEAAATSAACYWDDPVSNDLQVELLLTLGRLAETFAAAAMSIQHNRSFDAVCVVVPGCIAAIADAVIRRLATDRPSEVSAVLIGWYGFQSILLLFY